MLTTFVPLQSMNFWILYSIERLIHSKINTQVTQTKDVVALHTVVKWPPHPPLNHLSKRYEPGEKMQINYTSYFKKLLRFLFENILLKCMAPQRSEIAQLKTSTPETVTMATEEFSTLHIYIKVFRWMDFGSDTEQSWENRKSGFSQRDRRSLRLLEKLLIKVIIIFFAHKKYSRSIIQLRLNPNLLYP